MKKEGEEIGTFLLSRIRYLTQKKHEFLESDSHLITHQHGSILLMRKTALSWRRGEVRGKSGLDGNFSAVFDTARG